MKKKLTVLVLSLVLALTAGLVAGCGDDKKAAFDKEQVFHLNPYQSTPLGLMSEVCEPSTITFKTDGKAKMNVRFTATIKMLMESTHMDVPDFVHDDTYELSADKKQIIYSATRKELSGNPIVMDIDTLDDGSLHIEFDVGKILPTMKLGFYTNLDKAPRPPAATYAVNFAGGGEDVSGTAPVMDAQTAGAKITLPDNTFTREGWIFAGWSDGIAVYQAGAEYTVKAAVTFTAQWKKSAYDITFIGGEGATGTAPTAEAKAEGATITLPDNTFTKEGYDFIGWDDGTRVYAAGDMYTVGASDVTFTAKWKVREGALAEYDVTFRADNTPVIRDAIAADKEQGIEKEDAIALDAVLSAAELKLMSDGTASVKFAYLEGDDKLAPFAEKLGTTVEAMRAQELDLTGLRYTYAAATHKLTIQTGLTPIELTVDEVAKDDAVTYDRYKFSLPFAVGKLTAIDFYALNGQPTYLTEAMHLYLDPATLGFVAGMAVSDAELTLLPDGTGSASVGVTKTGASMVPDMLGPDGRVHMEISYIMDPDRTTVIWHNTKGGFVNLAIETSADGFRVMDFVLLGFGLKFTDKITFAKEFTVTQAADKPKVKESAFTFKADGTLHVTGKVLNAETSEWDTIEYDTVYYLSQSWRTDGKGYLIYFDQSGKTMKYSMTINKTDNTVGYSLFKLVDGGEGFQLKIPMADAEITPAIPAPAPEA